MAWHRASKQQGETWLPLSQLLARLVWLWMGQEGQELQGCPGTRAQRRLRLCTGGASGQGPARGAGVKGDTHELHHRKGGGI